MRERPEGELAKRAGARKPKSGVSTSTRGLVGHVKAGYYNVLERFFADPVVSG